MPTPDFLKPGARPASPMTATALFEFILQPQKLSEHLSKACPVPDASQLIIQFLQHARTLESSTTQPSSEAQTEPAATDDKEEKLYHVKKIHAMKMLAVYVATFGGWNMDVLFSEIPGPLLLQLLQEMITLTHYKLASDEEIIETFSSTLSDQQYYSQLLYLRWCLHTVLRDCLPRPPVKTNSIHVPGLTDTVVQMLNIPEDKITQIRKLFGKCKTALSESLKENRSLKIISVECLKFGGTALNDTRIDWQEGTTLTYNAWSSQVRYELGEVYFYEADYKSAFELFKSLQSLPLEESGLNPVQISKLSGYCRISAVLSNPSTQHQPINPEQSYNTEFTTHLEQFNVNKLFNMMRGDLDKNYLTSSSLDKLLHAINTKRSACTDKELCILELCYCIKCIYRSAIPTSTPIILKSQNNTAVQIIEQAYKLCEVQHKSSLISLINFLTCNNKELKNRLSSTDIGRLLVRDEEEQTSQQETGLTMSGEELQLVLTYEPDEIWSILCRINEQRPLNIVMDFYKLPKDLDRLFNETKKDPTSSCVYILISKAKELISVQSYSSAIRLLSAADKSIHEIYMKISKIIRYEILYCNLMLYKIGNHDDKNTANDLIRRVKSCLALMSNDSEVFPREEIIIECISYCLLSKEWEYLSSLHNTRLGFMEYARQMINVCKELPSADLAKLPARVLWDTSLSILQLQSQPKKPRLGNQSILPKDSFKQFLLSIKDPLVLSVLISFLTRLYNIKSSDEQIDRFNDFHSIWPESSAGGQMLAQIDVPFVKSMMIELVKHAINTNPYQTSWLKTHAEILFVSGHYEPAMRYYMQAANVSTHYFMDTIPTNLFNSEVYKRLVKCCVQLKMFTQAALLSLFIDDCEYSTIFKHLQEKTSNDNVTLYLPCIFDINILEFLINLYERRGETEKKNLAVKLTGSLEINSKNPAEILRTVVNKRQCLLFRTLLQQYSL